MNQEQARNLVRQTLTESFDKARFRNFALELLNEFDESKAFTSNKTYIKDAFKNHVERFERLGTYTSPDDEKLDVLIVHLTKQSKLERARTAIRNFVADHLKQRDGKDAALVAFVSPTEKQWRFSYVKMEYATVEKDSGKIGVETKLTPARRFSYIVGEGESCHTAQTRFLGLLQDTETAPTLAQVEEAFSVEAVTKEFFKKYAELFGEIEKALDKVARKDPAIAKEFDKKNVRTADFAKKLMGQIVFLYFIQKKGWLGVEKGKDWGTGPHDFLRRLVRGQCSKYENFFNDILEPLFYDTLATDRGHEAWCNRFNCRIPFLNGGLFEPLADYDWRKTDIVLPNRLFTNNERFDEFSTGTGVLDMFDRYNFTVNEAEPLEKEVAIDPEMLGKVFENLIEDNLRKGLGSYYTPREIVHYMCQESLISYLDTVLNTAEEPLSPAKAKQTKLFDEAEPEQTGLRTTVRRELIPRTDIERFVHLGEQISHYEAVETKYRIKMPKSIEQNARLLDNKLADIAVCDPAIGSGAFPVGMMQEIVRTRSALTPYFNDIHDRTAYHFKRHAIQSCLYGVDIDPGAVEIAKLRLWLSLVVDEEEVKQIKPLPNLDYKIVCGNSLFGFPFRSRGLIAIEEFKKRFFDETDHNRKAALKAQIDERIQDLLQSSVKSLGYQVGFDFQLFFSEVFHTKGGFDVVLANPPYIPYCSRQAQAIEQATLDRFRATYRFLGGTKKKSINTVMLFLERGLSLLTKAGVYTYIIDIGFFEKVYAAIRNYLARYCIDEVVTNLSAFENVASGQLVIRGRNVQTSGFSCVIKDSFQPTAMTLSAADFCSDTISLASTPSVGHLDPENFVNLGELCDVSCGLEYGALRDLFLSPSRKSAKYHKAVNGGACIPSRYALVWDEGRDGYVRFDKEYEAQLVREGRSVSDSGKIVHLISGDEAKYQADKLLIRQSSMEIVAAYDDQRHYALRSLFVCTLKSNEYDLLYILAILNSRFMSHFALSKGIVRYSKGKQPQIRVSGLNAIPIRVAGRPDQLPLVKVAKKITDEKRKDANANTGTLEHQIDELVYALYGLTPEEIKIVEESSTKSN